MKKMRKFFISFSEIFVVTLALGVILNIAAWVTFTQFPALLMSEGERATQNWLLRYSGELEPYRSDWFGTDPQQDWQELVDEIDRIGAAGGHVYEDFTQFKPPVFSGKFFRFTEGGYRVGKNQGPWPPSPDNYNIFFFGGSTLMSVGPGWTTIPSFLQEYLGVTNAVAKPVRVYNFGRGSYFSTQEKILFQKLINKGIIPDIAIFFDGLNDFFFYDGRPSGWNYFDRCLSETQREYFEETRNRTGAVPKWQKFKEFLLSLPLARAAAVAGKRLIPSGVVAEQPFAEPAPTEREKLLEAIERYFHNKRQIEAIAREYGVGAVFVWQPVPGYKYDLKYHLALSVHYGLGGHVRSAEGYPIMAQILEARPQAENFIWAADIQEDREEPLYLDSVHYNRKFSKELAAYIGDQLIARNLF